jgi:hypothetical protein
MKKKVFIGITIIGILIFGVINGISNKSSNVSTISLFSIEALSQEWGCGGVSTHLKHHTLKSRICLMFWRTHLVCKPEENVCCDPSGQTDCNGNLLN